MQRLSYARNKRNARGQAAVKKVLKRGWQSQRLLAARRDGLPYRGSRVPDAPTTFAGAHGLETRLGWDEADRQPAQE